MIDEYIKILFVYLTLVKHSTWCREYEECQVINERDVVVASRKSCAKYIYCDGESSYEGECLAGNYFNKEIAACDDQKNVDCNIEPNDDVKSIYDEDFVTKENLIQTATTDNGDKSVTYTAIKEMETTESGLNKVVANTTDTPEEVHELKCPNVNSFHNIRHIANPESCVAFFTCYNGHAIPLLCPGKMYFNENAGKCEPQMPESCKAKFSVRLNCHKGVYDFVPHPYRCEYYFYCLNGYLMIMRCPNDLTWHFERATCVQNSHSKCYSDKSVSYRHE